MTKDQLKAALKWALKHGIRATNYSGTGFTDMGCGCCAGDQEPPAELDAVVREIRREMIEEKIL